MTAEPFPDQGWHERSKGFRSALLRTALRDTLLLLLVAFLAEAATRTGLYLTRHDPRYLSSRVDKTPPAAYPVGPTETYTRVDPCSGREITFTVNAWGMRGKPWSLHKANGLVRLVALGGSSTYGANNPDNATWPSQLEGLLRARYGMEVEVLNAGMPGEGIVDFHRYFSGQLVPLKPDWVLYYEGWNDTTLPAGSEVDRNIRRLHQGGSVGGLSRWLYLNSWLYTLLLEKLFFTRASLQKSLVPSVSRFRADLEDFLRSVSSSGAQPVLILEVLAPDATGELKPLREQIQTIDLKEERALDAVVTPWLQRGRLESHDPSTRLRIIQTQILLEAAKRLGRDLGVQVIDPRDEFAEAGTTQPLFCDVVHLTDRGNEILAQAIAREMKMSPSPSRVSQASALIEE